MYKIGQTDGVAKCCSNVGVPVACIKTYLMKMAKSAADLPCACKAKSDMQVLASGEFAASTSSCCAGGTSSKTGGGGGGCCCGGCCGKSACGGKGCPPNLYGGGGANDEATQNVLDAAALQAQAAFAEEQEEKQPQAQIAPAFQSTEGGTTVETPTPVQEAAPPSLLDRAKAGVSDAVEGAKAVGGKILSTIDDVLTSDVPAQHEAQYLTAQEFQTQFCQQRPYPECKYCQYATAIMEMSEFDIVDFLHGIRDCLRALNEGQVGWAEQRFVCPGQIAAMLGDEFGEVGLLAGRTAAAAIIGSMALHGALKSVRSFSRQAAHHDLRCELTSTLCDAIRSGGGGNNYVELLNDIMCNLDIDARDQFRSRPWSRGGSLGGGPSGGSRSGGGSSAGGRNGGFTRPDGSRVGDRVTGERVAEQNGWTPISEEAKAAAKSVSPIMDAIGFNDPYVPYGGQDGSSQPGTKVTDTHVPVADITAQVDPSNPSDPNGNPQVKTYYYQDESGEFHPLPTPPAIGDPLAKYVKEYGQLYTEENVNNLIDTLSQTPAPALDIAKRIVDEAKRTGTPIEDLIEEMVETAVADDVHDPLPYTGTYTGNSADNVAARIAMKKLEEERGETMSAKDVSPVVSAAPVSTPSAVIPSLNATEAAYESPVLSVSGGGGSASKAVFENNLVDGRDAGKDPDLIVRAARALEALAKVPPMKIQEPSMSARDYIDDVVSTPSLVTRNQVPASEMAKLSGIGLSVEELSMAYVLDNDVNGSTLPRDVKAVRIPTILDSFPEW